MRFSFSRSPERIFSPKSSAVVTVPRSRFVNMPDIRKQYVSVSGFSCRRIKGVSGTLISCSLEFPGMTYARVAR